MEKPNRQFTPLARLVLFLFCLSLAGSFAALLCAMATALPPQEMEVSRPPENRQHETGACQNRCQADFVMCCGVWCQLLSDDPVCHAALRTCLAKC